MSVNRNKAKAAKDFANWEKYIMPSKLDKINQGILKDMVKVNMTAQPVVNKETALMFYDIFGTCSTQPKQKEEKENTMLTLEQQTLDYLLRRLENERYEKRDHLSKKYFITGDEAPRTVKEAKQRVKDGRFMWVWETHDLQDSDAMYFAEISWRTHSPDREGYETAKNDLNEAFTAAKDVIMVKTAEDGLEALNSFKATDFGPKPKTSK